MSFTNRGLGTLLCIGLYIACLPPGFAATSSNANSPLGINLGTVAYYAPELPFLNIMKTGGGWTTGTNSIYDTKEESYLAMDSGGWVTSLTAKTPPSGGQVFTQVSILVNYAFSNTGNGPYPSGQYVVLYDGAGAMTYGLDATLVSSSPGRDVINVQTAKNGIQVYIKNTDPLKTGNYIRNIRIVRSTDEAALATGQVFNQSLLGLLKNFHVLRFMDWLQTNNNILSSWAQRPLPTDAFWGIEGKGVPIEVLVQLANAVSADAWVNIPHMADNDYITHFASLVHQQLGSTQKVYVEYSNETWNGIFGQYAWITAQGVARWPTLTGTNAYTANRNWYGMRLAQSCDIWKSVWGVDARRVVCVLAAQGGFPWTATSALACSYWTGPGNAPCASHGMGVIAIGGYFGGPIPSSWTSNSDGGLTNLFASLTTQNDPSIPVGGWIGQAVSGWAAYSPVIASYNLPLLVYEGGWGFVGSPTYNDGTPMVNLFNAASRDPRVAAAYTTLLSRWKALGGHTFMQYGDVSPYNKYGEWGALESVMQTVTPLSSAPPKWQALQNFIGDNPCWWIGCTGVVASTPLAPTNMTVH